MPWIDVSTDISATRDVAATGSQKGLASLVLRRDADTTITEADGDLALPTVDSTGRMKVVTDPPLTVTGNITTQNLVPAGAATAGSAITISPAGRDIVAVQVTGTYTGALSVQGTVDGTNWVTLTGANRIMNVVTGAYTATITSAATGLFLISVDGLTSIRITGLAAMTGTAVVTLRATDAAALVSLDNSLPAGSATIGAVTMTSTTLTAVTPGVAAANLGKAEDATHVTGDTGVFVLAVRNDNAATTPATANADYSQISVDQQGAVFTRERPSTTSAITSVASSATNVTLLALNAGRRGASIHNDSTQTLYLKLGATASTTSFTVKVPADSYYEVPFAYTGIIDGIWSSANGSARVTEITA